MAQPSPLRICTQATWSGFCNSGSSIAISTQQAVQAPQLRPGMGSGNLMTPACPWPQSRASSSEGGAAVEFPKDGLFGRLVFRNGAAHPGGVHVMLGGDVLADDV